MQRNVANPYNFVRNLNTQTRYRQHLQWNQNFQPRRPQFQGRFQNINYQYWCETCDKGFLTMHLLENHKRRHQKCNIDGCQFVAHPQIITRHIQMQHSTGLFKRIAKLNNPDEIRKWREERKNKYPTLANIKKKEAIIKEKISRGEKMGIKPRSKVNINYHNKNNLRLQRRGDRQGNYNRNTLLIKRKPPSTVSSKTQPQRNIQIKIPIMHETRKLKPFAGIQELVNDDDEQEEELETQCLIEDDEYAHNTSDTIKQESIELKQTVCSALTSLISCYGSSDDDDDDVADTKEEPKINKEINKTITNNHVNNTKEDNSINTNIKNKISKPINNSDNICQDSKIDVMKCANDTDSDSGPEEVKINKEDSSLLPNSSNVTSITKKKELPIRSIRKESVMRHQIRKRNKIPSTLLGKLLHKEILHERNIILQCVRHVIKNKFFDKS